MEDEETIGWNALAGISQNACHCEKPIVADATIGDEAIGLSQGTRVINRRCCERKSNEAQAAEIEDRILAITSLASLAPSSPLSNAWLLRSASLAQSS